MGLSGSALVHINTQVPAYMVNVNVYRTELEKLLNQFLNIDRNNQLNRVW